MLGALDCFKKVCVYFLIYYRSFDNQRQTLSIKCLMDYKSIVELVIKKEVKRFQ